MMMNVDGEAFTQEAKALLQSYQKSKRLVRLRVAGSRIMLVQVHQVGNLMFHARLFDPETKLMSGWAHLPIIAAAEMYSLDEDNMLVAQRQTLQAAFDQPSETPKL